MNMHVIDRDMDRETERQKRLHLIENAALKVHRHALLSIGSELPGYHSRSMHDAFRELAAHLGYSIQKDAA